MPIPWQQFSDLAVTTNALIKTRCVGRRAVAMDLVARALYAYVSKPNGSPYPRTDLDRFLAGMELIETRIYGRSAQ